MMPPRAARSSPSQRPSRRPLALAACGTEGISVPETIPTYTAPCSSPSAARGCHTLDAAGTQGSANRALRDQGPNLEPARSRATTTSSSRSATAASRARSCPRTSSSATRPRRSPSSSPSTRAPSAQTGRRSPGTEAAGRATRPATPSARQAGRARPAAHPRGPRARRGRRSRAAAPPTTLDELLELDARRRELLPEVEERRARQNRGLRRDRRGEARGRATPRPLIAEMREVCGRAQGARGRARPRSRRDRDELAATLPNLPDPEAPDGETEEDAVTLREVGERPSFDFEVRDHLDLGARARLDRDGEGGRGLGLAVRLPARRPGDGRAGAGPLRASSSSRDEGFDPGRPAGAGPRGAAVRDRASSPASGR